MRFYTLLDSVATTWDTHARRRLTCTRAEPCSCRCSSKCADFLRLLVGKWPIPFSHAS